MSRTKPCRVCGTETPVNKLYIGGRCIVCENKVRKQNGEPLIAINGGTIELSEIPVPDDIQPDTAPIIELEKQALANEQQQRFDKVEEAKKERAARELARRHLLPFIKRNQPNYDAGWVHADIAKRLEKFADDIENKRSPRLMLCVPPRHGKSEIASRNFPAWLLGRNPHFEIIQASYASDLALDFSRKVRDLMKTDGYKSLFDARVDPKSAALERWNTTSGGAYTAVGVRGPITGRGAHCFPAGTRVATPSGTVEIQDLAPDMRVLTCDMATGKIGESYIIASHSHETGGLVTVTTDSGQRVRATRDHRFFVPAVGWVEAQYLRAGDPVAVFNGSHTLRPLFDICRADACGLSEEGCQEQHSDILQPAVPCERVKEAMCSTRLQQTDSRESRVTEREILLERMQESTQPEQKVITQDMPAMWGDFSADQLSDRVLFAGLCERSAQRPHDWTRELAFQRWDELRAVVSNYEATDTIAGWALLRDLLHPKTASSTSYRPSAAKQRGGESNNDVSGMPPSAPSLTLTSVSSVSFDSEGTERVYDVQVAGTSCFFAEEILVHNCGIIDDPVKDRQDAESETLRQQVKDWYSSTFYTRLAPGGGIVVIMTRWHEDDLAGWLVSCMEEAEKEMAESGEWPADADRWEVIRYPAIAEEDEPYRKMGEPLHESRYPISALNKIKRTLLPRDWAALYQQRPSLEDGDFFVRSAFRFYAPYQLPKLSELAIYTAWDLAIGKGDHNDYTVCVIVGVARTGDIYVLRVLRGRWNSLEILEKIFEVQKEWNPILQGIEQGHIESSIEPVLIKEINRRKIHLPYEKLKHRGMDKVARAQAIRTMVNQGRIWLPAENTAPWVGIFLNELIKFPGGKHDDQVDGFAWIGQMVLMFATIKEKVEDATPKWMKKLLAGKKKSRSAMTA